MNLPPLEEWQPSESNVLAPLLTANLVANSIAHCVLPSPQNIPYSTSPMMKPSRLSPRGTRRLSPGRSTLGRSTPGRATPGRMTPVSSPRVTQYTLLSLFEDTLAYKRVIEWAQGMSRDELYEALHQPPASATYGDRVARAKEPKSKPMPVPRDFDDHASYLDGMKLWKESDNHREKEKKRRARHFEWQALLHSMTCEVARKLAHSDPVLVTLRNGDLGTGVAAASGSCKVAGKDDQLLSNVYQNLLALIVSQSEHEGRREAEALVDRYRAIYGDLDNDDDDNDYHLDNHNAVVRRIGAMESPTKRRAADGMTPSKRRRIDYNCYPSMSSRLPLSPSPSLTASFGSQSPEATNRAIRCGHTVISANASDLQSPYIV